jgi:hypothetical protein
VDKAARMTRTSIWNTPAPHRVGRATRDLTVEPGTGEGGKTGAVAVFSGGLSAPVASKGVGNFLWHEWE